MSSQGMAFTFMLHPVLRPPTADNLGEDTVAFLPVLRALRIARIFRLIPRADGLRKLIRTLYW